MESIGHLFLDLLPKRDSQANNDVLHNLHRVGSNAVILRHVFGSLGVPDLKSCRLVCTLWEQASRQSFDKKAKIRIELRAFDHFHKKYSKSKLKVQNFEMYKCYQYSEAFIEAFHTKFEFLRSLNLENILLFDNSGTMKEFNLSPYLGSNLTSLTINSSENTTLVISQWNLAAIKYLYLTWCKVLVSEKESKIEPIEVHFKNVKFCNFFFERDIFYLDHFPVWSERFMSCNKLCKARVTNILGDVFYNVELDENAKPYINLAFKNFNFWYGFVDTGNVPVKKLTMIGIMNGFRWSYLPVCLEVLVFDVYRDLPDPPPNCLPRLRELNCKLRGNLSFNNFSSHRNLTKVQIRSFYPFKIDCDVGWIPSSVKELYLDKINPRWSEDFECQLESLTLVNCSVKKMFYILKKIKSKHFFCSLQYFPVLSITSFILKLLCWILRLPVNNVSVVHPSK